MESDLRFNGRKGGGRMDDMISRTAALDALGERPVVWSDNDDYTLGERNQYDMDRLAIETVPAVDAVKVARCKDCKWYGYYSCEMGGNDWMRDGNGFCDRGERKDGDANEK